MLRGAARCGGRPQECRAAPLCAGRASASALGPAIPPTCLPAPCTSRHPPWLAGCRADFGAAHAAGAGGPYVCGPRLERLPHPEPAGGRRSRPGRPGGRGGRAGRMAAAAGPRRPPAAGPAAQGQRPPCPALAYRPSHAPAVLRCAAQAHRGVDTYGRGTQIINGAAQKLQGAIKALQGTQMLSECLPGCASAAARGDAAALSRRRARRPAAL